MEYKYFGLIYPTRSSLTSFSVLFLLLIVSLNDAQAVRVDINGRANNLSNPAQIFLEAGTYVVDPIGTGEHVTSVC